MKKLIIKFLPYAFIISIKKLIRYLNSFFYSGNKFYCPNCNSNFKKLLNCGQHEIVLEIQEVVGSGLRRNCLCPRCHSLDRERLIYLFLQHKTDVFNKKISLLHIAPRQSLKKIFKRAKNISYYQGDKYEEGYNYPKEVIKLDITNLDFADNTFDVIICNHVLEHIQNDYQAIKELYRVMKPGGFGIIQVPLSLKLEKTFEVDAKNADERRRLFGQSDHFRIYAKDFKERLEKCNFEVNLYNPTDPDWNIDTELYALNKSEDLIVVNK